MKLSTLWAVDRMIDASGSSPLARDIASRWRCDPGSLAFFRSSSNFVYRVQQNGTPCFLRFTADSERQRAETEIDVELLRWLHEAGLPVVQPISSHEGYFVETIESKRGLFHGVLVAALPGEQFDIDDLEVERFARWGAGLAQLHATLRDYPQAASFQHRTWREAIDQANRWIADDVHAIQEEMARLASELAALPVDPETYGIIHGDFELDNLVWRDGAAQIIDFDDSQHMWLAADIAFALRDRFDAGADLNDPGVHAFLAGYACHLMLPQDAMQQLPLFSRLSRLLQYARIARALDLEPEPDHPAWLTALIAKLQARMVAYQTSLA